MENFVKKEVILIIDTIEKKYDIDLGVRGDMHLQTLLEKKGVESLNDLINSDK